MQNLKSYIQFLKYGRNLSETSCRQYGITLSAFSEYLALHSINERDLSPVHVQSWIMSLSSSGIKAVTVNNRIVTMRRYYDYCVRLHDYPSNPFVGIEPLKVPKLLPKFIPANVIHDAVNAQPNNTFRGVRAAAIVMLFLTTGIRREELLTLHCSDVDVANHVLHVFGKGRKERLCPLPDSCIPYLNRWFEWRRANVPASVDSYFTGTLGQPLSRTTLANIIRDVFKEFVETKMRHPHVLRHSFATVMMQAGVPIPDISRLMGHTNVQTTLKYLSLAPSSQYSTIVNSVFK